ncbi:MarR family winged helix-turn-helix transcriptional regulator [Curtobacterium sp. RRHDQ10]|uniref:MarR family winged helix-turn-helix transcriptional regulator n=1 Tax=Curtobacterium phyllosphaerae TaxID=3413379 RepID=UPI003BF44E8F
MTTVGGPTDGDESVSRLVNSIFLAAADLTRAGDLLAAPDGLTAARWLVLGALADGPLRVADIARRRGLTRQSARESIGRLTRDRMVERRANPDDARAPLFALTQTARDALDAIEPRRAAWAARLLSHVDRSDLEATERTLERLRARLMS